MSLIELELQEVVLKLERMKKSIQMNDTEWCHLDNLQKDVKECIEVINGKLV